MRTKISIVVMFVFVVSFLTFASKASAQDSPLNAVTSEEAAAKKAEELTKVVGCVEYKVDTEGGFICTKRADVVEVRGDNERDVIAITRDELNAMIDARINGRKESHDRNLNEAVGEYFYGPEMAKVFAGAEELRKKGLDAEAERVVRKAIGRDPDLRAAWEAYKKGQRQIARRENNLAKMIAETQLVGCKPDEMPHYIDRSLGTAPSIFVRGNFSLKNKTGYYIRIKDESRKIVVDRLCSGGEMLLGRYLNTFEHGDRASFTFTAVVIYPDGTESDPIRSPELTLYQGDLNWNRLRSADWTPKDPEPGRHSVLVKEQVAKEPGDEVDEEAAESIDSVQSGEAKFPEERIESKPVVTSKPAPKKPTAPKGAPQLQIPGIMMPVMPGDEPR